MMKRISPALTIAIVSLLVTGCQPADVNPSSQSMTAETVIPAHTQLLNGLTPPVRIMNRPAQTQSLTQRLEHHRVPGVSIAIMQNDRIAWTLEHGVKDLTTGQPVDSDTVFQAGSISKPTFAAVLMKYRETHGLDLDADVNGLLTSWQVPAHPWSDQEPVTLRRLLSHSAGTTVHGFPGYAQGETIPTLVQVLDGAPPANTAAVVVNIKPGSAMRYSGGGTTIAQLLLQDVSSQPLPSMAEQLLFSPLGMTRSGFTQPISAELATNMATPYDDAGNPVEGGAHTYATLAAAGMWSTPSDLLRLGAEIRQSYLTDDKENWLSQASATDMLTSNSPTGSPPHVGMGNGYAILTNGANGRQLIRELEIRIKEAFDIGYEEPTYKTIPETPDKVLAEYLGTYRVTSPVEVDIVLSPAPEGFRLTALPYIDNEMHWHEGDGRFFALDGSTIHFERNDDGQITTLVMDNRIRGTRQ
ncbi:serine hydrolase [Marisediminitalea aggregata]|uniref:serine hydrolase n=1 Tax=Marisediminitalea aggregata TaxID=634436 RepID=UPI0020CEC68A|nr:serine hydrolase [Marisediminitalea aggregata]MCP9479589.1 serine hydrolase [Marisediminitalea aggregata]